VTNVSEDGNAFATTVIIYRSYSRQGNTGASFDCLAANIILAVRKVGNIYHLNMAVTSQKRWIFITVNTRNYTLCTTVL